MNCKETQNLIDGYVDGELDLMSNLEIERHFRECADCREQHKNHEALRSGIKAGPLYFTAPADLQRRIRWSLRKAAWAERTPRLRPKWWLAAAASVAVAALAVLALVPLLRQSSTDDLLIHDVVSSHVRALMMEHLADIASSDRHTVKPWFNGKVDFSPPVVDLARLGFPLVGGRLDYLDGRPVAALVYRREKHFIDLFVWPSTHDSEGVVKPASRQGYHLLHWTRSGMTYWAVSDLEEGELQEFVQLLQNQPS